MAQKISRETLPLESPDVLRAMRPILKTPSHRVHITLAVALLAACSVNLLLVWARF
jgi:hypothetical protein